MNRDEYVTTIVVGKKVIPIGLDDAGQTYFFEYVDENGLLAEECCGTYNTQYTEYIEYMVGDPRTDCPHFNKMAFHPQQDCENKFTYGYCDKCPYQDSHWTNFQTLIKLGIIDRRGNVKEAYSQYLIKRKDDLYTTPTTIIIDENNNEDEEIKND